MPVPASINDLSTTASSNSPAGSETPQDGDNYLRTLSSFIAELRDKLNGTDDGVSLDDATLNGTTTVTGHLIGTTALFAGFVEVEDLQVNSTAQVSTLNVLGNLTVDQDVQISDDLTVTDNVTIGGFLVIAEGLSVGNTDSASTTRLDHYLEDTFTPGAAFGGGTTGITYNANTGGNYTRTGDRVSVDLRVRLSSKGSSSGSATITGLPIAAASTGPAQQALSVYCSSMTGLTGAVKAITNTGSTNISLVQSSSSGDIPITEVVFTNSADIYVTGVYRV